MKYVLSLFILSIMSCSESEPKNETIIPQNPVVLQQNLLEWQNTLKKLRLQFGLKPEQYAIIINISKQSLYLIRDSKVVKSYPVSTSKYGTGNKEGSNKTPVGTHRISEKIGKDSKIGTIFKAGKNTKTIAKIYSDNTKIQQDYVTTRIICLEGLEEGINKGSGVDSNKRCIYIHGTPEEGLIGKPSSRGCIRMKNSDIIELFDLVTKGTLIEIQE